MRHQVKAITTVTAVCATIAVSWVVGSLVYAQRSSAYMASRIYGKPNLNGMWQANFGVDWDLEPHSPQAGPPQFGALFAIPAGVGVVEGGRIPYKPEALEKKRQNERSRWTEDPIAKCYKPGVPRFVYLPFAFQIVQGPTRIMMASEYAGVVRPISLSPQPPAPLDTWMGQSTGRFEGETLVVEVTAQNGQAWFDRAGNFATETMRVIERFTPASPERLVYEATIEDPAVFTRPWKISLPLHRRTESNAQLLEFNCVEFAEPLLYGNHYKIRPF